MADTDQFFPISKREIVIAPLYEFVEDPPGIKLCPFPLDLTGTVRVALARYVSNISQPDLPSATQSITWIVVIPDNGKQDVSTWQEGVSDEPADNMMSSLVLERAISQVIPFTNDQTSFQTSLNSLVDVLSAQGDPSTGAGLWVDSLLVEQTDGAGNKSWILYEFAVPPDAPAGPDKDTTYCCQWLGCGYASGWWAYKCWVYGCAGVCTVQ
ncbi:MAG: hypothetical protein JXR84_19630 [Anaerolineae bacterium]|nr:hypothetical protein [Anaerolineae bacterium]